MARKYGMPTPPSSSKKYGSRSGYAVSPTAGRVVRRIGGKLLGKTAMKVVGKMASRAIPYVGGVTQAYRAAQVIGRAYKSYRSRRIHSGTSSARKTSSKYSGKGKGATMSKSAGYFNKSLSTYTTTDKCADQGVVYNVENGDVISDTRNVTYLAHSTMPAITVAYVCFGSMFKNLLRKVGLKIKNWDVPLLEQGGYPAIIRMHFKGRDGNTITLQDFPVSLTKTLSELVIDCHNFFLARSNANTQPQQFLRLQFLYNIAALSSASIVEAELDLTNVSFEIVSDSHFKIQNRTVTSSTKTNADDVDNVPIYGKSFDFKTNSTIYRDYSRPGATGTAAITTQGFYGVLRTTPLPSDTDTKLYEEVPLATQFLGVKHVQSAHLDPGEIKTSVMKDAAKLSLAKLISVIYSNAPNTGFDFNFKQSWIGKTRLFAFEKMIDSVATTTENAFKLAYEHNLCLGAICSHKTNFQTAPQVVVVKGPI